MCHHLPMQNYHHLHPMANYHHLHPMAPSRSRRGDGYDSYLLHQIPHYHYRDLTFYGRHGTNVRGGLPEMRYTGRLQNSYFEISSSLGSHLHPSYLHYHQVLLHRTPPPLQGSESINFNPRSQIPSSSSHRHQIYNIDDGHTNFWPSIPIEQRTNQRNPPPEISSFGRRPAIPSSSSSSYRHQIYNVDDGHRNFWPSIPIEQRTNQRNPPPEVSSFGRRPAIRILDDVIFMDGVRNSDVSNRWFNNEDVPYEELLNLQRQLPRINTAEFSRVNINDGNRNFWPFIPIEQRTNQGNLTSEVSGIDLPAMHLQDGVILVDDALLVDLEEVDQQELLGLVETRLSRETILRHLRTRTHISSTNNLDLNEELNLDQVPEICVVCHGEYENHEEIGTLQCGHEYHADCIMKWLQQKNVCPICKAKALPV